MQTLAHETYSFDEFRLDLTRGALFRGATQLKLRPKSFDVLKYLAENSGRLITKDELIGAVWRENAVTDDSLVQCLKDIRQALGDHAQRIIKTVPRRGYIFEKEVSENGAATVYTEETTGVHLVIEETEEPNGNGGGFDRARHLGVDRKSFVRTLKRRKLVTALALGLILITGGGMAYGVFVYLRQPPRSPFTSVTIKRLTTDGIAASAAVSPDGKYFSYVSQSDGQASLWVRQITAVNDVKIAGPSPAAYGGIIFSPDSNFLYYIQDGSLYQSGTLGGSTRKISENVSTRITFAPDGKRIAFVRVGMLDGLGSRLVMANADGTGGEQILAYRKPPEAFTINGCGWSPDGETLVCAGGDNAFYGQQYPLAVRVADGRQTQLTSERWNLVRQPAWMADGSGFVMAAYDSMDNGGQLWHVTFPAGVATRVYSDLNDYTDLSLTQDSKTIVAVQRQPELNIHAMDLSGEPRRTRQLTFGTNGRDGWECVETTPDSKIVYSSEAGGGRDLWVMDSDGGNNRQLTFDEPMETNATVSPDGRSVAFGVSSLGIWRIDLDGGNKRQLTPAGMFPEYSADGKWIFYTLPRDRWTMWKVPADGAEPARVTDQPGLQPTVSPDGKWLAYMSGNVRVAPKLQIMPVEGGGPVKVFDALPLQNFDVAWLPDGLGVAYKANESGVQKIVVQPTEGGQPYLLLEARSDSEGLTAWSFSRDGKQLYYSAGPMRSNVVMFTLER